MISKFHHFQNNRYVQGRPEVLTKYFFILPYFFLLLSIHNLEIDVLQRRQTKKKTLTCVIYKVFGARPKTNVLVDLPTGRRRAQGSRPSCLVLYCFIQKCFFYRYSTLLEVSFSEKTRILFIIFKSISKPCYYD